MFVQVIQGKVADATALRAQFDKWMAELGPAAEGFLGATFGITADDVAIGMARFESAELAARNNARPEQADWWVETEKAYAGPVTFTNSTDVDTLLQGPSDDAGFVQVMQGRIADLERARALEATAEQDMPKYRPDVIGSVRARYNDGQDFTEFIYFTSEAEARKGESAEMPEEAVKGFSEWQEVVQVEQFHDLSEPWHFAG